MKKIISLLVSFALLVSMNVGFVSAQHVAEIYINDITFSPSGSYDSETVKKMLSEYENLSSKDAIQNIKQSFGSQLKAVDIFAKNVDSLEDIYGIQFDVSVDSNEVAIAYFETNVQSGSKIGQQRWGAYYNHGSEAFKTCRYLSYGSGKLVTDVNKKAIGTAVGSYKIATMYLIVANDCVDDFNIKLDLTDVAAKDNSGVISIANKFKSETSAVATVKFFDNQPNFSMLGAQIRVAGKQGLRFGAVLYKDASYSEYSDISYGVLIAVEKHLKDYSSLTLDNKKSNILVCENSVLEDNDEKIIFCGQVTNFPKKGSYDSVNFVARAYVTYKTGKKGESIVVYSEPIVRNVEQMKTMLGMK